MELKVGVFNVLADGQCLGEFATLEGDRVLGWGDRGAQVVDILREMLETYDVVVTVENDHFFSILEALRSSDPDGDGIPVPIEGVFGRKRKGGGKKDSTCRRLMRVRQSSEAAGVLSLRDEHVPGCFDYYFSGAGDGSEPCEGDRGVYLSDDGIGMYYNSERVLRHECILLAGQSVLPGARLQDPLVVDVEADRAVLAVVFSKHGQAGDTLHAGDGRFVVAGGHLPSGEGMSQEDERRMVADRAVTGLLHMGYGALPIVLAMDSNTCDVYVDRMVTNGHLLAHQRSLAAMLATHGFTTHVSEAGTASFKCFKVRHARGAQPSKYGAFMYVCIDKICLRLPTGGQWRLQSAESHSPTMHRCGLGAEDEVRLVALRDGQEAETLRSMFFGVPLTQAVPAFDKDAQPDAVLQSYPLAWGDRLAERLMGLPDGFRERFAVLEKLFPNANMPSDHPAVGVNFHFSFVQSQ
jgi:hypothetical protein